MHLPFPPVKKNLYRESRSRSPSEPSVNPEQLPSLDSVNPTIAKNTTAARIALALPYSECPSAVAVIAQMLCISCKTIPGLMGEPKNNNNNNIVINSHSCWAVVYLNPKVNQHCAIQVLVRLASFGWPWCVSSLPTPSPSIMFSFAAMAIHLQPTLIFIGMSCALLPKDHLFLFLFPSISRSLIEIW